MRPLRVVRSVMVLYDTSDDSLRGRLAATLSTAGTRLQYSAFMVTARPLILEQLHRELKSMVKGRHCHLVIVDLGSADETDSRMTEYGTPLVNDGRPESWRIPDVWIP